MITKVQILPIFVLVLYWQIAGFVWADPPPTVEVILSTPLSSRINQVGNKIQAVVREQAIFAGPQKDEGQRLPAGTTLKGLVEGVESSTVTHRQGRIRLVFTDILLPTGEVGSVNLIPDTPDGWISPIDGILPACKIMPGHSTRLLNTTVRRRLPCDRGLWSQALGINSSDIPDPSTDKFMVEYNRHDVLLGAGDWLRLRRFPYPVKYLSK